MVVTIDYPKSVEEFNDRRASLACVACGAVQLVLERHPNNNGLSITCEACGRRHALGRVHWIRQSNRPRRTPYPLDQGLDEVWERYGNVCCMCGLTRDELEFLRFGRDRHHAGEYVKTAHAGPILPICKPCHTVVNARQKEAQRWLNRLRGVYDEPVSPSGARISAPGVSPDPMCATGETPPGAVEGFSDDDADA